MVSSIKQDFHLTRTSAAFMWTRVLNTPFWALYSMLPFFLYKDLHATPLQVTLIIALKPLVSLISLYWSASVNLRRDRLVSNVIWAGILGHMPFFFFPFFNNVWFFIFSFGIYSMLNRGVIPAWMEILKINIRGTAREQVFAYGTAFGYLGSALFPILMGWILDDYVQSWRWLFPCSAVIALTSIFFQLRIPISVHQEKSSPTQRTFSFYDELINPWSKAWKLVCERPDFGRFQIGFMLGGFGLMVMQPALPHFFVDSLLLSYTELAIALTVCKGLGFALTSPLWAQWMNRVNIYFFSSWVTGIACLFPIFLTFAQYDLFWVYIAYISYGVMQAGSELSWNLSGPIFAKDEDSSVFSSVNVLTVGLRGCLAPILGSFVGLFSNSLTVILLGAFFCALSSIRMLTYSRELQNNKSLI